MSKPINIIKQKITESGNSIKLVAKFSFFKVKKNNITILRTADINQATIVYEGIK